MRPALSAGTWIVPVAAWRKTKSHAVSERPVIPVPTDAKYGRPDYSPRALCRPLPFKGRWLRWGFQIGVGRSNKKGRGREGGLTTRLPRGMLHARGVVRGTAREMESPGREELLVASMSLDKGGCA